MCVVIYECINVFNFECMLCLQRNLLNEHNCAVFLDVFVCFCSRVGILVTVVNLRVLSIVCRGCVAEISLSRCCFYVPTVQIYFLSCLSMLPCDLYLRIKIYSLLHCFCSVVLSRHRYGRNARNLEHVFFQRDVNVAKLYMFYGENFHLVTLTVILYHSVRLVYLM